MTDWQTLATQKRNAISSLIPPQWRLPSIPTPEQQRNVTGEYIQQFLTEREVEITETDAVGILDKTKKGEWRAEEVARAFCRRAGVAHQLVCLFFYLFYFDGTGRVEIRSEYDGEGSTEDDVLRRCRWMRINI